jgi:Fic family protein
MLDINQLKLNMSSVNAIAAIDEFKGKWDLRGDFDPELLTKLYLEMQVAGIKSAMMMADQSVLEQTITHYIYRERENTLGANPHLDPSLSQTDQFIWGNVRAWNFSQQLVHETELVENQILKLHDLMLGISSKDRWHAGKYKISSNNILASKGVAQGVRPILETAPIAQTPTRMSELLYWLDQERKNNKNHPLVRVLVFTLGFLEIHPFQDGNERLAKILLRLLLLQEGYAFINYAPLESILELRDFAFYESWTHSHQSLNLKKPDLDPWLDFMLGSVRAASEQLMEQIDIRTGNLFKTPSIVTKIMEVARMRHRFRIGDIINLTHGNRSTLKFHLRKLVESRKLIRRGQGAGIYYEILI